ncbi:hypothetical protein HETIRDRAFT_454546 [Heterobasidion irregulare TC 32-1]|uniref:Uncharacterized protein n=1 Tax=Heterobasidion irregulare (strain TC 32-1) TaxID=747525 RepID=W4JUF8_HETIT|nr:uncharacterized protein HETIRDRAFT_454546 [Heterobasidion irregulare TC 32-1]ETW77188.1 hypothetical protein HETIRDRAFT_454546 [Heterobasidion irregulare TC 32-1]
MPALAIRAQGELVDDLRKSSGGSWRRQVSELGRELPQRTQAQSPTLSAYVVARPPIGCSPCSASPSSTCMPGLVSTSPEIPFLRPKSSKNEPDVRTQILAIAQPSQAQHREL